jgi:hypothetical protein
VCLFYSIAYMLRKVLASFLRNSTHLKDTPRGGVVSHTDTVVPAQIQKRVNWAMKSVYLFLGCHFCIMSQ